MKKLSVAVFLAFALAISLQQVSAESSMLSFKTSVHQCLYQNNLANPACPDGAFISDISDAHTLVADAGLNTQSFEQAESSTIALAMNQKYTAGSFYTGGDRVTHIGHLYQCRPYPASNLCGQAPATYEPGTGWDWEQAWVQVK